MKKILGRILIVLPSIALQLTWYYFTIFFLNRILNGYLGDIISVSCTILAVFFVTSLVSKRDESSYKILWIMVIVAMPILGAVLYLLLGNKRTGKHLKRALERSDFNNSMLCDVLDPVPAEEIKKDDLRVGQTLEHISKSTGFPILKNDTTRYYPFGEDMFADMCEDLKTAKKYIFVEYFIIQSGKFWDTLTDILAERAADGVDVRVMYDDLGSIGTYSVTDIANLSKKGIKCIPFNPFFFIRTQLNNRDHRKIMVIDGKIAYSGGVNLADEYINEISKFGRWKDIGFRITGEAVMSYAYMFTEFWNTFSKDKIEVNIDALRIEEKKIEAAIEKSGVDNGYIIPYYDSPMRDEHTSNEFFSEVLSMATDYVRFYTPYLILGDALFDSFIRAAKRGVDVRIIMPGIPDKKMVFRLSRSYYKDLIAAGVKIYEYTPGFVHAKAVVSDDKIAGVGTVNLDYRSLFLHFECNSIFYKADIVEEVKKDFLATQSECRAISPENVKKIFLLKFLDNVLRIAAPLL